MTLPESVSDGDTGHNSWHEGLHERYNAAGSVVFNIAASDAPAEVKKAAHYVVSGSNDQDDINTAYDDGFGWVRASVGTFDIRSPILQPAAGVIQGSGWKTILKANGITTGNRAVVTNDNNARACVTRDLQIHGNYGSGGPCHGVNYVTNTTPTGEPDTGPDATHKVLNCLVSKCDGSGTTYGGVQFLSTNSNNRSNWVDGCYMRENGGWNVNYNGSSDSIHTNNHFGGCNGTGVIVGGGNTQVFGSKQFFADLDGWQFSSSRPVAGAVIAQDNGRHGFYITSSDFCGGVLQSDTNGRLQAGSGIYLSGNRAMIAGFHSLDRNATSRQDYGLLLSGAPDSCIVIGNTYDNQLGAVSGSWGNNCIAIIGRENGAPLLEGLAAG